MATQLETVRRHLRDHGTLTSVEASEVYKIRRLASRVHELRAEGLKVRSVRRKDATGQRYIRYKLED